MKILIITNTDNEEIFEDIWIANSFIEDGCQVEIVNMDYDENLDNVYNVFIRRNTWYADENKILKYYDESKTLTSRLRDKKLCTINFNGRFDGEGKKYLVDLYEKGYMVVPSVNDISKLSMLPISEYYLLKPINSYDGIGQVKVKKDEVKNCFSKDYIIQPYMKIKSEVQFYFIGTKFEYALEFCPSKVPVYPDAIEYKYTQEELKIAEEFAKLNKDFVGVQRIDFMKTEEDKLLLLEIEDTAPYLDLDRIDIETREKFLMDYKNMVYRIVK